MPRRLDRANAAIGTAVALLMAFQASQSFAADPSAADLLDYSLEDLLQVEVSVASRIPTTRLDAASSVEVIPRAQWQRRGARTVGDALAAVPGVAVLPALGGADAITIRGYARGSSLLGILVSWDGVPLDDLFRGAPMLNVPGLQLGTIDEIQLIEGPGSALYGSDAFHGVVALEPFDTRGETQELRGGVRDDGYYAATARLGANLGAGAHASVALTAEGQPNQHLGYTYADPVSGVQQSGERANRYDARTGSAQFRGQNDNGVAWHAGALLHDYDGQDYQGFGTRLAGTRDVAGIDTELALADGGVRKTLADGAAIELSAYTWQTDSTLRAGRTAFDFESANSQRRSGIHGSYERAPADASTQWALALGAEALAVDEARTRNYDPSTGALTLDRRNAAEGASRRIYSATFEGRTHWSDERFNLVYGLRLDQYSDFGRRLSPRLGLVWRPSESNAIKLLYGNAFRAPAANEINGTPGLITANPALDPENIDTLELVIIHQRERWLTEIGVFHSDWDDGIVSVANVAGPEPFVFMNSEENRAHGVTWKLDWQSDPWSLDAGVSWVESENKTLGQSYGAFPRYIIDTQVGYRHAQWDTTFYLTQHWQIDAEDVFPAGAGFAAIDLPLYTRTDLGASRPLSSRWNLLLFVRNLLDRDNVLPSAAGSRGGIPDEPRTLSLEARFAF